MQFKLLLKELEQLNLPKDQFAITSSGTLAVRNIREANDLDVIVIENLWKELIKKYSITKCDGYETLDIGNIQVLNNDTFRNDEMIIKEADLIDGIRYVKLEEIKKLKIDWGREKDLRDVELIDEYLSSKP